MNYKDFREQTQLNKSWNRVITWNGYTIGNVRWHNDPWTLLKEGTTFDEVSERSYEPIARFHTQEELWRHIKSQA